jgi:UrcA family protein
MSTTKLLAALAVTTAIGGAASPSWSQPNPDEITVRVPVGDLNLGTEPGATVALTRISSAAREICGPAPTLMDLNQSARYQACLNRTVGTAVASANQPMLTAVAGRSFRPTLLASR